MITEAQVRKLLIPFGLDLGSPQIGKIAVYLELLLRWNGRVNLTAIRTPEECVTRHFGESLYLARWVELKGANLDVGSGAGFPGLALKIVFPELQATLLEPMAKKRAFLKEVIRTCGIDRVDVRPERLEEWVGHGGQDLDAPAVRAGEVGFDSITARAVGRLPGLIGTAACCLRPGGRLCLWVGREQSKELMDKDEPMVWQAPIAVPLSLRREILVGVRLSA